MFAEARIHCVNLLFIICLINIILMVFIALYFFFHIYGREWGWGSYSAHWDMAMWIPELYRWARIFS